MINQIINKINKKEERHRRRIALFSSLFVFVLVFSIWSVNRGIIKIFPDNDTKISNTGSINLASVSALSPIESSQKTLSHFLRRLNNSYLEIKESLSNVFVPFITSIEVYQRK